MFLFLFRLGGGSWEDWGSGGWGGWIRVRLCLFGGGFGGGGGNCGWGKVRFVVGGKGGGGGSGNEVDKVLVLFGSGGGGGGVIKVEFFDLVLEDNVVLLDEVLFEEILVFERC